MGLRCYCLALLLGVAKITTAQYEDGPPAAFYGPPTIQQAIMAGPEPLPVVGYYEGAAPPPPSPTSGALPAPTPSSQDFPSPAPVVETLEVDDKSPAIITDIVTAPQSIPEQPPFQSPAAFPQIKFEATPMAPQVPAENYGVPEVVTETISAPPAQPELPQFTIPILPQAPAETPIPNPTAEFEAQAEMNGASTTVEDIAVAAPSSPEINLFESPAPQPQQGTHEILRPLPIVPVYGVPAEVGPAGDLQTTGGHSSSLGLHPFESPEHIRAPIDTPAPPPPTPEVNIPADVNGSPTSDNELVSIPSSPPVLALPSAESSQASVEVKDSSTIEQEIVVSRPSPPLLPHSLQAFPLSPQAPEFSEFPAETPETVPHVYWPPIISRNTLVVPPPLLKLRSYIFPLKIKIPTPWIPIPRTLGLLSPDVFGQPRIPIKKTFGIPAQVYGPPQGRF